MHRPAWQVPSFLRWDDIVLYLYTIFCLFIHMLLWPVTYMTLGLPCLGQTHTCWKLWSGGLCALKEKHQQSGNAKLLSFTAEWGGGLAEVSRGSCARWGLWLVISALTVRGRPFGLTQGRLCHLHGSEASRPLTWPCPCMSRMLIHARIHSLPTISPHALGFLPYFACCEHGCTHS